MSMSRNICGGLLAAAMAVGTVVAQTPTAKPKSLTAGGTWSGTGTSARPAGNATTGTKTGTVGTATGIGRTPTGTGTGTGTGTATTADPLMTELDGLTTFIEDLVAEFGIQVQDEQEARQLILMATHFYLMTKMQAHMAAHGSPSRHK